MFALLSTISWRHVRRHRLRTLLTFVGMALGVAVIVAIALVNRSLSTSFQATIEQIAGKAVLQVSNAESGIAESIFPTIRDTEGVQHAAAAVEGFLPVSGVERERLYVLGADLLTDSAVRDHQFTDSGFAFDQALDFIAQPDSIALTESFARRFGLRIGARITLGTSAGKQSYTVRALLKEQGTARVFGGNFALMDLPAAQRAFGKEGKLDIVDLTVEEGSRIEAVQERLRLRLSGMAEVERPKKRGEQIESLLTSFRVGLFFVSLIALFVGFFLIYNTVCGFGRATQAGDRYAALPGHAPGRVAPSRLERSGDPCARGGRRGLFSGLGVGAGRAAGRRRNRAQSVFVHRSRRKQPVRE